ncbi:MAG: PEGA domain-containing protein [Leptospirales bacterium]|nr:PEGA domain-containing protein [Leptospirales bacterium]
MLLMPLRNESGQSELDYLGAGIVRLLAGRLERSVFVPAEEREATFLVRSDRGAAGGPRFLRLRLQISVAEASDELYRTQQLESPAQQARQLRADYLLRGSFDFLDGDAEAPADAPRSVWLRGRPLRVRLQLFNAHNGAIQTIEIQSTVEDIYRSLGSAGDRLELMLAQGSAALRVATAQSGALVYLDDLFLGRTPLESRAPPGDYVLRVEQSGMSPVVRPIRIVAGARNEHFVELVRTRTQAALRVETDPPGATVFLNQERIGQTPLMRQDLPAGTHRLRIEKDGMQTLLVGVEMRDGSLVEVRRSLRALPPPDANPHPILDYSYLDLSFYSALGALGGYGVYVYFDIRKERILDRSLAVFPLLGIWQLNQQFPDALSAAYGYQRLQNDQRRADRAEGNARIGGALGIVSLIAAGWFLYVELSSLDPDASGELPESTVESGNWPAPGAARELDHDLVQLGWQLSF